MASYRMVGQRGVEAGDERTLVGTELFVGCRYGVWWREFACEDQCGFAGGEDNAAVWKKVERSAGLFTGGALRRRSDRSDISSGLRGESASCCEQSRQESGEVQE